MFVDNTATHYLNYLLGGPYSRTTSDLDHMYNRKIHAMEYMLYRYIRNQLICSPLIPGITLKPSFAQNPAFCTSYFRNFR